MALFQWIHLHIAFRFYLINWTSCSKQEIPYETLKYIHYFYHFFFFLLSNNYKKPTRKEPKVTVFKFFILQMEHVKGKYFAEEKNYIPCILAQSHAFIVIVQGFCYAIPYILTNINTHFFIKYSQFSLNIYSCISLRIWC